MTNWDDDISGFELFSERSLEKFTLIQYSPVLDVSNSGSKPVIFYLSYIVPKSAERVVIRFPDKFGGLKVRIYEGNYFAQIAIQNKKGGVVESIYNWTGVYFVIPYVAQNVSSANLKKSTDYLGIGFGLLPYFPVLGS